MNYVTYATKQFDWLEVKQNTKRKKSTSYTIKQLTILYKYLKCAQCFLRVCTSVYLGQGIKGDRRKIMLVTQNLGSVRTNSASKGCCFAGWTRENI
jgi:hypothetical protein